MNRYIIVIITLFISMPAFSQYKKLEGEIGLGLPLVQNTLTNEKNPTFSPAIFGEIRFNIPESKFSVGANFIMRGWEVEQINSDKLWKRNIFSFSPLIDYNFAEFKRIQPFVGTSIGIAQIGEGDGTGRQGELLILPRIGVEVWNRARISASYLLTTKSHSYLSLNIGFVFGGGKK